VTLRYPNCRAGWRSLFDDGDHLAGRRMT